MNYTIENLFDAIHYCNKYIKVCNSLENNEKSGFYKMKQRIIYHLIKNSDELGIIVTDCHIDKKIVNNDKDIQLYSFELKYGDDKLLVHQKYYAKLKKLIKSKNIYLSEEGEYKLEIGENFNVSEELFNGNMIVISHFHTKWGLDYLES